MKISAMQRRAAEVFLHTVPKGEVSAHFCNGCAKNAFSSEKNLEGENEIMKTTKLVMLVMTIAVVLFMLIPNLSWAADDGAATFKAKCATCHGADAAGKPAMKAPSLISDEAKRKSDEDFAKAIHETAKHTPAVKSLPADDVTAVIAYIRPL